MKITYNILCGDFSFFFHRQSFHVRYGNIKNTTAEQAAKGSFVFPSPGMLGLVVLFVNLPLTPNLIYNKTKLGNSDTRGFKSQQIGLKMRRRYLFYLFIFVLFVFYGFHGLRDFMYQHACRPIWCVTSRRQLGPSDPSVAAGSCRQ